jgi:hypothetical protein
MVHAYVVNHRENITVTGFLIFQGSVATQNANTLIVWFYLTSIKSTTSAFLVVRNENLQW